MKIILCIVSIMIWAVSAESATYYANPSGSGSTCSSGSPCSLSTGLSTITGGDTLILQDGTYTGKITNPPSGTAGSYTIIKAANDGNAIVTDTTAGFMLRISGNYIQVEGLKLVGNSTTGETEGAYVTGSYNKILKSAFVVTPCVSCYNKANVTISGNYNLIEDSWAWGAGRYKFIVYGGDTVDSGSNNILRRVVARHDREFSGGFNPQSAFTNYQGKNNLFQNVLNISSDQNLYYDNTWRGPFFLEKGQKAGNVSIAGSIALGFGGTLIFDSASGDDDNPMFTAGNLSISNTVGINGHSGFSGSYYVHSLSRTTMNMDHSVIGSIDGNTGAAETGSGSGFCGGVDTANNYATATNNIFYNIKNGNYGAGNALWNVRGANNYNSFYGNIVNYGGSSTAGANDITNINPLTASLRYPVRIESGSPLKGAGAGGSDIGPTILKRIGVSGTLYGEPGYNTVTSEDLWPWPNEDRIKADMSSYPSNWPVDGLPSPTRGFTTGTSLDGSSQTLTKYVWEYLGNAIPADIYSTDPINGVCGTASGQSFPTTPSTNLCATGTATAVSDTGPWTWGCNGANGGTSTSSCSATLAGQAVSAVFKGSKITGGLK